jgi:hypothetical protein
MQIVNSNVKRTSCLDNSSVFLVGLIQLIDFSENLYYNELRRERRIYYESKLWGSIMLGCR